MSQVTKLTIDSSKIPSDLKHEGVPFPDLPASKNYKQDSDGTWWYYTKCDKTRSRCKVINCKKCSKPFLTYRWRKSKDPKNQAKFCSWKCAWEANRYTRVRYGKDNPQWKGGKRTNYAGYVLIHKPEHPSVKRKQYKDSYVLEHRLVMEKELGRYLEPWEEVHHKNGIKTDNRIENLELWLKSQPAGVRYNEAVKHCPTCTCSKHK